MRGSRTWSLTGLPLPALVSTHTGARRGGEAYTTYRDINAKIEPWCPLRQRPISPVVPIGRWWPLHFIQPGLPVGFIYLWAICLQISWILMRYSRPWYHVTSHDGPVSDPYGSSSSEKYAAVSCSCRKKSLTATAWVSDIGPAQPGCTSLLITRGASICTCVGAKGFFYPCGGHIFLPLVIGDILLNIFHI